MTQIKVLIVGAGLGGLCLAQSLRNAHIDFEVFERDLSPWDRTQGYRLHLEADALNALREVLPPDLHRLFDATAMRTNPFTTILKQGLSVLKRIPTDDGQDAQYWPQFVSAEKTHCNVDRATLREIVLLGIEERCHFNKRLLYYDSTPEGVTATFSDATTATGHVLIGADGLRSVVRQQRAPQLKLMDAGVQAIYGRVPYSVAAKLLPGETLHDIFGIAIDERKLFLGTGAVKFPTAPDVAAQQLIPPLTLKPQEDYAVCIVGGRHELFPKDAAHLHDTSPEHLQALAVDMIATWPQPARDLVASGDRNSFFIVNMSTSVPGELDAPTNVTLLGDAIHAMTPTLGRGANLAMRDAALLGRQLQAVATGEKSVQTALTVYEEELTRYGFDVVRESVEMGQQRMGQNPLPGAD
jgi:2-polyprenyl-6-methoxyphenol hydroxylase-like FAD-dependent oxidoreductase